LLDDLVRIDLKTVAASDGRSTGGAATRESVAMATPRILAATNILVEPPRSVTKS
jgi:hypothetical protein